MKIKFSKLVEATEAFRKLSAQDLEIKKAVEVSRLIKKLEKEYEVFKGNYTKILQKYGKLKDEEAREYEFVGDNREKFTHEVEELMNIECTIDSEPIEINDDIRLSAAQVIALEDFIRFKE